MVVDPPHGYKISTTTLVPVLPWYFYHYTRCFSRKNKSIDTQKGRGVTKNNYESGMVPDTNTVGYRKNAITIQIYLGNTRKKNVQQPSGGEPLEDTGHIGIKIGINKLDVSAHHGKRRHQKTLVGVDIAIIKMQLKIHHIREHILKTPIKVKTESKPYKEDIEKGG